MSEEKVSFQQHCILCEIPIKREQHLELRDGDLVTCHEHEQIVNAIWFIPEVTGNDETQSLPEATRLGRERVASLTHTEREQQGRCVYESIAKLRAAIQRYPYMEDVYTRIIHHKDAYLKAFD